MAGRIEAPRGTRDLLPEEGAARDRLEAIARDLARRYALQRLDTPLFERVDLFARGLGESSDAVEKEMFSVAGPSGTGEERADWALRPEPTAGIVRAYVEHGLHTRPSPLRVHLIGPMFRYDRPQAGRYRQFSQWDVEVIGDAGPMVDAEMIELAHRFYAESGVRRVMAHLNSLGDPTCRPRYRQALIDYFTPREAELSEDSRRRLRVNPLRVLDDKSLNPDLARDAPRMLNYLCDDCRAHFEAVVGMLDRLKLAYVLDPRLVRGVDYYTRTTFEFFVVGREGQQQALGGGGRYDGLVELLGGRPTPGVGFGVGLDRTILALEEQGSRASDPEPLVAVVGTEPLALAARLEVATRLRGSRLPVWVDGSPRRLGRQLEAATKTGAHWAVIVGDELQRGAVTVKDLRSGAQREVPLSSVRSVSDLEVTERLS